jgi:A/G-specific adenine glycosylase
MISSTRKFAPPEAKRFGSRLLGWYDHNKRRLPWRGERDPYRILVSEVMLQQTRVAVVEQRYHGFLRRFPTLLRLARAREQSVLAAWSGLGYYRRARSLHAAAKSIAASGRFPQSATLLRQLPGIGRYTANAVASIAFGEPVAVVDGNVKRVLTRLSGRDLENEPCWQAAGHLLSKERPGDFNQALMELGALICLPQRPLCSECPVNRLCASRSALPKRSHQARRKGVVHYALARRNGSVLLVQRHLTASLMPGMWELPALKESMGKGGEPWLRLRHSITNTDYSALVHAIEAPSPATGRWVSLTSADRLPLTGLTRKVLQRLTQN